MRRAPSTATFHSSPHLSQAAALRETLLVVSFVFFLYPISMLEGGVGISVNYSFAVFPLATLLLYGRLQEPRTSILVIVALFALIFLVALIYQRQFLGLEVRRFTSFLVFMTLFTFVIVKIDQGMIAAFRVAIVLITTYFSIVSILMFVKASASGPISYEAKDLIGSQRYGFIYLLGFWITFLFRPRGKLCLLGKYAVLGVLLAGLFLTFSRSCVVALLATFGLFVFVSQWQWLLRPTVNAIVRSVMVIAVIALFIAAIDHYFPLTFAFYGDRLIDFLRSGSVVAHLQDPETSEGTRVYVLKTGLEFVIANPLTGAGYLGYWALPAALDSFARSAHNQYLDVLLRTGVIGFCAYSYLIFGVLRHVFRHDRPLFWGFTSVLVYGLFHETFKESQGAFVLAFLVGMSFRSGMTWIHVASRSHRGHPSCDVSMNG